MTIYVIYLLVLLERDGGPLYSNSFIRLAIVAIATVASLISAFSPDRKVHVPSMLFACASLSSGLILIALGRLTLRHGGM